MIGQRTAVINQIRGFLLECGVPVRQGPAGLREALPVILTQRTDVLSPRLIHLIEDLADDWRRLDARIDTLTRDITALARQDASCRRLMGIPGVGVITASAMVAAIGTGAAFAKGRDFAAWLGLVPKQISTGDRTILGSLSKRGNRYLRTLFVGGAQALLQRPHHWKEHRFGRSARRIMIAGKKLNKNKGAAHPSPQTLSKSGHGSPPRGSRRGLGRSRRGVRRIGVPRRVQVGPACRHPALVGQGDQLLQRLACELARRLLRLPWSKARRRDRELQQHPAWLQIIYRWSSISKSWPTSRFAAKSRNQAALLPLFRPMQPPCASQQANAHPGQDDSKRDRQQAGKDQRDGRKHEEDRPDLGDSLGLRRGEQAPGDHGRTSSVAETTAPAASRDALPGRTPVRRCVGAAVCTLLRASRTISVAFDKSAKYVSAMAPAKSASLIVTSSSQFVSQLAIFRLVEPIRVQ